MNKKLFIGLFLAGMTTLSACVTANDGGQDSQPRPSFQTKSEEGASILAACVDDLGTERCKPLALELCKTIQEEAFSNPYSSGSTLRNFNNGDAETQARFKRSTANSVMKYIGYGEICE